MTLVMPLADPSHAGILSLAQNVFQGKHDALKEALDAGGTVHFARFVVIGNNLVMASSYDGDFRSYIAMFIDRIGETFNQILSYVADPADPPPTPVAQHVEEFIDWVGRHDRSAIGFYSGYDGYTTQVIRKALKQPLLNSGTTPPPLLAPMMPQLPADAIDDIQGLILRGFTHPFARHFQIGRAHV